VLLSFYDHSIFISGVRTVDLFGYHLPLEIINGDSGAVSKKDTYLTILSAISLDSSHTKFHQKKKKIIIIDTLSCE
jgi:hypothetical protein